MKVNRLICQADFGLKGSLSNFTMIRFSEGEIYNSVVEHQKYFADGRKGDIQKKLNTIQSCLIDTLVTTN
jgi:hypothetical protein